MTFNSCAFCVGCIFRASANVLSNDEDDACVFRISQMLLPLACLILYSSCQDCPSCIYAFVPIRFVERNVYSTHGSSGVPLSIGTGILVLIGFLQEVSNFFLSLRFPFTSCSTEGSSDISLFIFNAICWKIISRWIRPLLPLHNKESGVGRVAYHSPRN